MSFYQKVYEIVRRVPEGRVASYGQIARMAGSPRASRAVGHALHVNPMPGVNTLPPDREQEGRLAPAFAFGGTDAQRKLLEAEGVKVDEEGYVDIKKYCWNGK